jgi:hypothetical protein
VSLCASFNISSVAPISFGAVTLPAGDGVAAGVAATGSVTGSGTGISGGASSGAASTAAVSSTGASLEPHPANEKANNAATGKAHQACVRFINKSSRRPEEKASLKHTSSHDSRRELRERNRLAALEIRRSTHYDILAWNAKGGGDFLRPVGPFTPSNAAGAQR